MRKLAAIEALSRHGLAQAGDAGFDRHRAPNTWPTAAVIDWLRILKRVDGIADRARRNAEAQQILRSRLTFAGTTLKFSTEASDGWWWLMDSADANAARLILAVSMRPAGRTICRGWSSAASARQQGGAWATTTANLWGVLALEKFSARFESTAVSGVTEFSIGAAVNRPHAACASTGRSNHRVANCDCRGRPRPVQFRAEHRGAGQPWLTVQALAAIALKAPFNAGYGSDAQRAGGRAQDRKAAGRAAT